ncbi:MAG: hypothetical protein BWY83_01204 [bacterium ADurb.Bin478]|nr:MAG: hypothetical protein BWY83_01204 [bacterium ADurb.Bin478]
MKKEGVCICIPDVCTVELLNQLKQKKIPSDEWQKMTSRLSGFISDVFPVLPGNKQLYSLAKIIESDCPDASDFDYRSELINLTNFWTTLSKIESKECLQHNHDDTSQCIKLQFEKIELILQKEHEKYISHACRMRERIRADWESYLEQLPEEQRKQMKKDPQYHDRKFNAWVVKFEKKRFINDDKKQIDKIFQSSPVASVRMDLFIKYLVDIALGVARYTNALNPESNDRRNDGIDFLALRPMLLPSRFCTKDGIRNKLNCLKSFQASWVVTPSEAVDMWKAGELACKWPDN